MMRRTQIGIAILALSLGAGCATQPTGPTVQVMPAPNKPFEQFRDDDILCRNYAAQQIAGGTEQANQRTIGAAALGTVLGAGLGAAAGEGKGAAVGAAGGALLGTAIGAEKGGKSEYSLQRQYDIAYQQCMYAKGNQVPGFAPLQPAPPPPPQNLPPPR